MGIMTIEERKELRLKILRELYDHYFSNNGTGKSFNQGQLNGEDQFAYNYLMDKGLIKDSRNGGNNPVYKITTHGMDAIESQGK